MERNWKPCFSLLSSAPALVKHQSARLEVLRQSAESNLETIPRYGHAPSWNSFPAFRIRLPPLPGIRLSHLHSDSSSLGYRSFSQLQDFGDAPGSSESLAGFAPLFRAP